MRINKLHFLQDFNLYVAGYVNFFNPDTTDCDDTTFYWWKPGYKPTAWNYSLYELWSIIAMLKTDLRKELNHLVEEVNRVIQLAVEDANADIGGTQVYYVDVQPYFEGLRWCENADGSWHEPDSGHQGTYFFLSAWPDISVGTNDIVRFPFCMYFSVLAELIDVSRLLPKRKPLSYWHSFLRDLSLSRTPQHAKLT